MIAVTESDIEEAVIGWLADLGWIVAPGALDPDAPPPNPVFGRPQLQNAFDRLEAAR